MGFSVRAGLTSDGALLREGNFLGDGARVKDAKMRDRSMNKSIGLPGFLSLAEGLVLLTGLFVSNAAIALPFNDDMVHDQYKVSEVQRPLPQGSIPLGSAKRFVASREEALKLENPIPATKASVNKGERLFNTNCSPCHGKFVGYSDSGEGEFKMQIPLTSGIVPGPNFAQKYYVEDPTKTDGHIFGYIYFGGLAIMPRYGYKLSIDDHWNIVNYIRSIQSKVGTKEAMAEQGVGSN